MDDGWLVLNSQHNVADNIKFRKTQNGYIQAFWPEIASWQHDRDFVFGFLSEREGRGAWTHQQRHNMLLILIISTRTLHKCFQFIMWTWYTYNWPQIYMYKPSAYLLVRDSILINQKAKRWLNKAYKLYEHSQKFLLEHWSDLCTVI